MWTNPGTPVPIDPSQLVVGLYIWLDVKWTEHPFLANRFLVDSANDVAVIQALDVKGRLYYFPNSSSVPPARAALAPQEIEAAAQAQARADILEQIRLMEKAKKAKLRAQKDAAARADQAWGAAARATREALLNLARSPKVAGQQIKTLSKETASIFSSGDEVLLHLLGDSSEQGPHFHALNCTTLCMLVGQKAGLNEKELADLAMAALAHDVGESQIPAHILKNANRKPHEEDYFRQHVKLGMQFALESGAFSHAALTTMAEHHEAVDGSGWPAGKKDLSVGARILGIVDRYDTLCAPDVNRAPMMPAQALATMFRKEGSRYDPALLSTLIKLLGVYPPGTVVHLSNGALAMVVAPGKHTLKPKVLVYNPDLPKDEAPALDLDEEPDLKIVEAIAPATLPPHVLQWLNPHQRLSYYFSLNDGPGKATESTAPPGADSSSGSSTETL
jgi:HD-GYP domain-containing protein (c-di-GMP phosphodiesterase class II)